MSHPVRTRARRPSALPADDAGRKLLAIAESSYEAMIACQRQGRIEVWNPGATHTFGLSAEQAFGRPVESLIDSGAREEFLSRLALARQGQGSGLFRSIGLRPDGTPVDISVALSPLRGEEGGVCMVARDVSDRRRAEEEESRVKRELLEREASLRQALAALRGSHEELKLTQLQLIQAVKLESLGRLAAGVAHEVKNPLAVILAGAEYLLGDAAIASRPGIAPVLEDMRSAVARANGVIMGLLNYSAATELKPSQADVNEVVTGAVHLVQHALVRGKITLYENLAPDLPRLSLDVNKLQQVFVNLLINAVDATPAGGTVRVRTRRKQLGVGDEAAGFRRTDALRVGESVVLVSVEDSGAGFDASGLQRAFDPFFTTKPTGKGTGLGLAVSKTIVALHGGLIWAANRPEGGAMVTVVLRSPSHA